MSKLQIKLNDGTRYDIKSFNDAYIGTATGEMEFSDEMQYRVICKLADYSVAMNQIVSDFTEENLTKVSIVYNDGSAETEQITYENLKLERVNKYFSIESGVLSSGYDVVFSKA